MSDCRCAICGCCEHDHRGWKHNWTDTQPKGLGFKCPSSTTGACLNLMEGWAMCDEGECWRDG